MKFTLCTSVLLSLAAGALAENVGVGFSFNENNGLARRQNSDDIERAMCVSSVLSALLPPTPTATGLNQWLTDEEEPFGCRVTVPASLSDDYTSWQEEVTEWLGEVEDIAGSETDCGADTFTMSFESTSWCDETHTAFFRGSNNETVASVTEEAWPVPTGTIWVGGALRGAVPSTVVFVLAMGVAWALA
ncbi:hypothetical protein B0I35DRAFT_410666 [Stachybotrys elegans]|uniref:Infection structure specific protein n=1 Tax=Stachybotrys elegans TaxID=80388 RepID=A0A8K0SLC0_9HYPO|nr:hypothetical protein B0I35DRAFT_410666 [Stachybotrys elegans]